MTVGCTLREVWEEVRDATITLLGGVTFADLAKRARRPVGGSVADRTGSEPGDRRLDSCDGRRGRLVYRLVRRDCEPASGAVRELGEPTIVATGRGRSPASGSDAWRVSPRRGLQHRLTPPCATAGPSSPPGTLSQTSFSALAIGLPVLVPTLREEYDLSSARSASCSGRSGSARS